MAWGDRQYTEAELQAIKEAKAEKAEEDYQQLQQKKAALVERSEESSQTWLWVALAALVVGGGYMMTRRT
jgi:hypothetical protein